MPAFDLETLLSPLPGDAPCGPDLEYDPVFIEMQALGAGRPEQEYGDTRIAAVEPEWTQVRERALRLAARSRDLRVAVWLTRCGARLGGLEGAVEGLRLVLGLLERHWPHVHPIIDPNDRDDPTARLNAIAPLAGVDAGLADFRAAKLTDERNSLTVRDLELAIAHAKPYGKEAVASEESVLTTIAAALATHPSLVTTMRASYDLVTEIALVVEQRLGVASGLDLVPLHKLLRPVNDAAKRVQAGLVAASGAPEPAAALQQAVQPAGGVATRDDVVRLLDRACEWIERNEPSHPAPLLIRRAQRLMAKSFVEIVRDIAPDGMNQLERVAGQRFE